jgi:hypothetical protein
VRLSAQQVVLEDAPDRAHPVAPADLLAFATLAVISGSKPKRSSSISIFASTSRRKTL